MVSGPRKQGPTERDLGEEEADGRQPGSQEVSMLPVSWAWSFSRSLSQPQLPERLGRWADGVLLGRRGGTAGTEDCCTPHLSHLPRGPAGPACSRQCPVALSPLWGAPVGVGGSCPPPRVGASMVTSGQDVTPRFPSPSDGGQSPFRP